MQLYLDAEPFDPHAINLPRDRQAANALAMRSPAPTIQDVVEFRNVRIGVPERCPLVLEDGNIDSFDDIEDGEDDAAARGSRRYDSDWYRLVCCHDPWADNPPLRGPVYRLGSLSGSWTGRFTVRLPFLVALLHSNCSQQTNFDVHLNGIRNPQAHHRRPAAVYSHPLFWELKEHHCLHPNTGVDPGTDDFGGEDFLNAWLPRQCEIIQLQVSSRSLPPLSPYETFYVNRSTHYGLVYSHYH